jgi:hypothetical protein
MNAVNEISPASSRAGESRPSGEGACTGVRASSLLPFERLPIGAAFRIPGIGRISQARTYVKTGPMSYGLHVDEAAWQWNEESPFVEMV